MPPGQRSARLWGSSPGQGWRGGRRPNRQQTSSAVGRHGPGLPPVGRAAPPPAASPVAPGVLTMTSANTAAPPSSANLGMSSAAPKVVAAEAGAATRRAATAARRSGRRAISFVTREQASRSLPDRDRVRGSRYGYHAMPQWIVLLAIAIGSWLLLAIGGGLALGRLLSAVNRRRRSA